MNVLVKDAPFPYFILDKYAKVLECSNEAIFQFGVTDSFINLIPSHHQEKVIQFLQSSSLQPYIKIAMKKNENSNLPFKLYKKIDQSANIHLYIFPIDDGLGDVSELLKVVENKLSHINKDIVHRIDFIKRTASGIQEATNQLESQKNIEKLAAGIAHEIRNPLTTVKGFLQLLKPYLKEIGKIEYAEVALEEINRANDIIYEFLNGTKPASTKSCGVSVNKLIKEIVLLYESEAILRNIQLESSISNEEHNLPMDANQLKQVLVNLMKNAIEAIDEKPADDRKIMISTNIELEHIAIQVSDSGCGMTEETKKSLFSPFFSTKEKGTGIGLSLCKKIIEKNHGTIHLNSKIGKGTTFTIRFPVKSSVPVS